MHYNHCPSSPRHQSHLIAAAIRHLASFRKPIDQNPLAPLTTTQINREQRFLPARLCRRILMKKVAVLAVLVEGTRDLKNPFSTNWNETTRSLKLKKREAFAVAIMHWLFE
jgi:hypothetical protein